MVFVKNKKKIDNLRGRNSDGSLPSGSRALPDVGKYVDNLICRRRLENK